MQAHKVNIWWTWQRHINLNLKASQAWSGKGTQNEIRLRRQENERKKKQSKKKGAWAKKKERSLGKEDEEHGGDNSYLVSTSVSLSVFFGIIFKWSEFWVLGEGDCRARMSKE